MRIKKVEIEFGIFYYIAHQSFCNRVFIVERSENIGNYRYRVDEKRDKMQEIVFAQAVVFSYNTPYIEVKHDRKQEIKRSKIIEQNGKHRYGTSIDEQIGRQREKRKHDKKSNQVADTFQVFQIIHQQRKCQRDIE